MKLFKTHTRLSKALLLITLAIVLTGCSNPVGVLTGALGGGSGPSLEVSPQIGEEANKQIVGEQNKTNTEIDIDTEGDVNQRTDNSKTEIFNTNIPLAYQLLMILGWILPSPKEIYRGIKGELKGLITFLFKSS